MTIYEITFRGNDDPQRIDADDYKSDHGLVTFVREDPKPGSLGSSIAGTQETKLKSYPLETIKSIERIEC